MLIAIAFVALVCGTAPVHLAPPPIHISLTFTSDVSPSLVRRLLDEANAVWRPSGVTFAWDTESRGTAAPALWIVVDDERGTAPGGLPPLGWILFDGQGIPGRMIHLSYANAVALLNESPEMGDRASMPIAQRETYLGRAMGRALAHELGHYLLASKAHTATGLMRGTLTATELFASERSRFEMTPPLCEGMLTRLFASASTMPSP
jgi:hypothetical protein